MDNYRNNLLSVAGTNKFLYEELANIEENSIFEVFCENDLANANILDHGSGEIVYQDEPIEEIKDTFNKIEKDRHLYKTLYIYGIGNGFLLKMLLQNSEHKYIYIFEPEIELIYIALNLQDFSKEILDNRVMIFHTKDFSHSFFKNFLNSETPLYFKTYDLLINTSFYNRYKEDIKRVNSEITNTYRYLVQVTGNSAQDELIGYEHWFDNLPLMLQNASLKELVKKGANTKTAIIISTGPSLNKQLSLLKEVKDYATLFAIDASLPVLEKAGIKPDITLSLERVRDTGKFYKKTSKEFQKDIIFALSSVVDKDVLNNIKSGTFQISMRPSGNHNRYIKMDDWGYIGYGLSAANMAYELISLMDFDTAIFIGQDLAYGKSGQSHSKGHIFGENEVKQGKNDELTTAYGGNGKVITTKVWKMFKNGLEMQIELNKTKIKLLTINATEGGARIEGAKELSFKDAIKKYIKKNSKKSLISLKKPSKDEYIKNLDNARKNIENALSDGEEILKNGERVLKKIAKLINSYKKYPLEEIDKHLNQKEMQKMADKIAIIREQYYIKGCWDYYGSLISPLLTHLEYDIAYWSSQPENSKRRKLKKQWMLIVLHHEWLLRILSNLKVILDKTYEKIPALKQ